MVFSKRLRWIAGGAFLLLSAACAALCGLNAALPDTFYDTPGSDFSIASMPFLSVQRSPSAAAAAGQSSDATGHNVTLSLFGLVPVKTVRVAAAPRRTVQVCGTPFGVKMFSDGALVVAFSDRYSLTGRGSPAKEAGLRLGDLIVSAGGQPVRSNDELSAALQSSGGQPVTIEYRRGAHRFTAKLIPAADATGTYKAGMWVRDSSAGIGTMTFLDATHGTFAGLGHAISDTDTGTDVTLLSGEIVPVLLTGAMRGTAGSPGELRGEFCANTVGTVLSNDASGLYGRYTGPVTGFACPVAQIQELSPGKAELWTTISGSTAKPYTIQIEKISLNSTDPNRNLLLRVTDPELLRITGGIVQGMSGSPIVQNGKLAGAVTHVIVNDPTRGYGIFAASMLERADAAA